MRLWPLPCAAASPVGLRHGGDVLVAAEPVEVVAASGPAALAALRSLTPGWWAGYVGFDLGRVIEPVATRLADDEGLPDLLLARYEAHAVIGPDGVRYEGPRRARVRLEQLMDAAPVPAPVVGLGASTSSLSRDAYQRGVREIIGLIEAGDCFQVNLTRRVTWPATDPVALSAAVRAVNPAPHESVLVVPHPDGSAVGVVSASPERFLSWRGRDVETRPIKGTDTRSARLLASAKDRAENVMIVDLARNDLGRCCDFGTVQVSELCAAHHHPGLVHLVSTVRGRRRVDADVADLIRATFPPASVTGAPKPRVLQIIEDLEPCRRGVYCGAVGWIDTEHDRGEIAVAIRTFTMTRGETRLATGAGIVADSDPAREWDETELKVARLSSAVEGRNPDALRTPA
jgi:para-aminobenzoate synthetase component I